MLKINTKVKKYKVPLIIAVAVFGGVFLFQYLTFIPEYSSAESISTENPNKTLMEITYMQEMTSGICERSIVSTSLTGDVYQKQLIDGRDGKSYWVARLADGRCWMTQDLDLDLGPDGPELRTKSDGASSYEASATTWNGARAVLSTSTGWSFTSSTISNINWYKRNTFHGVEHNSLGNLYSYEAATAGVGHNVTSDGNEVLGSICPAGWKLPSGGSSVMPGSFSGAENVGMTSASVAEASPYFFQLGGIIDGDLMSVGVVGAYWSSTSAANSRAYSFSFNSADYFNVAYGSNRFYGYSVRCVNNPDIQDAPAIPEIDNPNVSVTVDKILIMEIPNKEINIEPKTNDIATGEFSAKISSNAGYDISLSTVEGGETSLDNADNSASIPATNNVVAGTSGWGIKCTNATNCLDNNYHALTSNLQTYFTASSGASNQFTNFEVGIGISPSLPSGTYSTNILVTASQK